MSYEMTHHIYVECKTPKAAKAIGRIFAETLCAPDEVSIEETDVNTSFYGKCDDDFLIELSRVFKGALFTDEFYDGSDVGRSFAKNGHHYSAPAEIVFPEFDETKFMDSSDMDCGKDENVTKDTIYEAVFDLDLPIAVGPHIRGGGKIAKETPGEIVSYLTPYPSDPDGYKLHFRKSNLGKVIFKKLYHGTYPVLSYSNIGDVDTVQVEAMDAVAEHFASISRELKEKSAQKKAKRIEESKSIPLSDPDLAQDLVSFIKAYDPYDYADTLEIWESDDDALQKMSDALLDAENVQRIRDALEEILAEENYDWQEEIMSLLNRLP